MQNDLESKKDSYLGHQKIIEDSPPKRQRRDLKARKNKKEEKMKQPTTTSKVTINLSKKDTLKKFPIIIKKSINK